MSATDNALKSKTLKGGTTFSTKSQAQADFKAKYSTKYVSSFTIEPRIRPTYIPTYYSHGGIRYNVIYDPYYHSYGYWGAGHVWFAYSVMNDSLMMNSLMNQHGYYNDYGGSNAPYYHGNWAFGIAFSICMILLVIVFITILARS